MPRLHQMTRILALLAVPVSVAANPAHAENTRPTNPNAISLELLGKAFLYDVQYDRAVSDNAFAGIGIGSVALNDQNGNDISRSATLVPIYGGYYFLDDGNSPFAMIGVDITLNQSDVKNQQSSLSGMNFGQNQVFPYFGVGWETRTDSGFLFRVTGYGMIGSNFKPWGGATFGYAF